MATRTYTLVIACGSKHHPRYQRDVQADSLEDAQDQARAMLLRARRYDPAGPAWDYWGVRLLLPAWSSPHTIAWGTSAGVTWTYRQYGFKG